MVGFVVVSHSKELAEAAIHLANEMKRYDFPLINGSGTDGDLNDEKADIESVLEELNELKTFSKLTY